jgi:tetratricopeptide (TPR) repeat protein
MFKRITLGVMVCAAALTGPPLAATASDGGIGGLGIPAARGPTYDPNKEFHAGIEALGAGKYRAAKQNFEHVLAMIPDQPVALSMLGQSEDGLGDLHGAVRNYQASLKADPHQIVPARNLAIADEKLGRHDQALIQLRKLKERVDACAESCAQSGDLTGAVRDVEAAISSSSIAAAAPEKKPGG